jgi:hypothetical protein
MEVRRLAAACLPAAFFIFGVTSALEAQLPATRLASIYPAGANPGAKLDVTIAGADLDDVNKLQFSHAGITAVQKMAEPGPFDKGPQPVANTFELTIAANVPPGRYEARVVGKYGMSNPRAFTVGTLPELLEVEPNNAQDTATAIEKFPTIVNGRSQSAGDVDFYKITVAAGQRIVVDCFARRIDSRMDAVLTIYDSSGRELNSNRNQQRGESLLDFTAPAAGDYFVKVNDTTYQGTGDYFYRLSVGAMPHIDFVFPPAGIAGSRAFTVYGRNLPGGQPAGISIDGHALQKITTNIAIPAAVNNDAFTSAFIEPEMAGIDATPYQIKSPAGPSNIALVGIASAPPVNEVEPNNTPAAPQKLTLPCEVQGQFFPKRDRDWFEFEAKKDDVYTIEIISNRLGLPTDPNFIILQVTTKEVPGKDGAAATTEEQVKTLVTVEESTARIGGEEFDGRSSDPVHEFKVPADGRYRILVRDSQSGSRADPRNVYRLAIRPQKPDFRLVAVARNSYASVLLRKSGHTAIEIVAIRRDGFAGDITVSATGMPAGVTCPPVVIGGQQNSACLMLAAAANAAPATGLMQVTGRTRVGNADVTRPALIGTAVTPLPIQRNNNQPRPPALARLARNLAVSISEKETAPIAMTIGNGQIYETPRAGIVKIPYKRAGDFKGKLTVNGVNLPANFELKQFDMNPNGGEFPINLKANTPTGTFTIHLRGLAQQVKYARNPEAAAAATERKKEVDKINAEAAAAAKAATDAKTAADKAATDTAAAAKAANDKKVAADAALTAAMGVTKDSADKAAAAKAAATAKPDDATLASAATAAQRAADDAATKLKAAQDAVAGAQTGLDDANVKAKVSADAKTVADKAATDAAARAKAAMDLKTITDKRATDTAAAAKPANRNVAIVSNTITIKIAPAPITLAATQPAAPLKQGEKIEIPVSITRLFGFAEAVTVSAPIPSGVAGISIPNATIAKGQNAAKLTITAAANATAGQHNLTVRAALKLNNQDLTVEQPITLNVQKVEKPAQ